MLSGTLAMRSALLTGGSQGSYFDNAEVRESIIQKQGMKGITLGNLSPEDTSSFSGTEPTDTQQYTTVPAAINLPQYRSLPGKPSQMMAATQEWEGTIMGFEGDYIIARLTNITRRDTAPEEIAQIPWDQISPDDVIKAKKGSVFRWAIGFLRQASGTRCHASVIYFRRLATPEKKRVVPKLKFSTND